MTRLVAVLSGMLVLLVAAPAIAQPFADTPATHWAYDAIAQLVAKGLIEGYPDGTFKGGRAMTRYEMAMVVARLVVRIESIQIPPPTPPLPKPEVTREDIDVVLSLVNEFRAELATALSQEKNGQLTAVEDELNAIKARLDNVKISGGLRFRYELGQLQGSQSGDAPSTGINGNPLTGMTPATGAARGDRPEFEFKVGIDGSPAPDIHLILGLESALGFQSFNSSATGFNLDATQQGGGTNCNGNTAGVLGSPAPQCFAGGAFGMIDSFFLDWKPAWAQGFEVRLGRFGDNPPCGGGCYPIQFGPFGLLMNDTGNEWEDATANSGLNQADGLWVLYSNPDLWDLRFQAVWLRINGKNGINTSLNYPSGEDAYGAEASVRLFPGFRLGAYYVGNSIGNFGATGSVFVQPLGVPNNLWHLYGPGGGSLNPAGVPAGGTPGTPGIGGNRCITVNSVAAMGQQAGIACPAAGHGWGAYVQWDVTPVIHLDLEAANWTDTTLGGGTDAGIIAAATFNVSKLFNICCNLTVQTGYEYFGPNFYSPYGGAEADLIGDYWDVLYPGNAQGFWANASITPWPAWTFYGNYLTGFSVSNTQPFTEWVVGLAYQFATNANIQLKYIDLSMNGIDQQNVYRAEITYSF